MTSVVVLGAGGKMGYRVTKNLARSDYEVRAVDVTESGRERIRELGLTPLAQDEAIKGADAVVLAIPDTVIGKVSHALFPKLPKGIIALILDAAAPVGGELPNDCPHVTYFLAHPCHPAVFYPDDADAEERRDHMGGIARQAIVCALMQGPEEHYAIGEAIAKTMWDPVIRAHRVTADQLGILEPGLSEIVCLSCIDVLKKSVDKCEAMGLAREAAFDFLMGHINVELAMNFGFMPNVPSEGAKLILAWSQPKIFRDDWDKYLEIEHVREACRVIARGRM
jgi:D-apionate oxidoisomerase